MLTVAVSTSCAPGPEGSSPPNPSAQSTTNFPSDDASSAAVTSRPDATPTVALPEPGLPFGMTDVLNAMQNSRRPGGVPDQVETQAIATAIAERTFTFDGDPWLAMTASGSCSATSCTVEIAGAPSGALGEDVYVFTVDTASGAVALSDSNLRGLPEALLPELDAAARGTWNGDLDGLILASARWLPPPDRHVVILSYRSGGEEGAPAIDLRLDVARGTAAPVN